ncbi:MAG TPA: alpha/beta fold hydrolase [Patescibacteria group bacterium]|nr:alpha/beta fold hydrolase [Patescibacteria group bacterium]
MRSTVGSIGVIVLLFLSLVGIFIAGYSLLKNNKSQTLTNIVNIPQGIFNPLPSPTPFPFAELTMPYLRNRDYQSKLGELSVYSQNPTYTSYLTNYDSDGLKINGLLTVPKGEAPVGGFPAIVFVHGYIAPSIYETTQKYTDYVNFLAKNGFVVFKIDLRGHGDSEGEAGGAYYSSDYVIDTLNAYSALENAEMVNPKKIGLWGHSMAGNVTFRSFVVKKNIPALVIWAGAGYTYSDLLNYRITDNSYRAPQQSTERARKRQELRNLYGEFSTESEFWKKVPATNYLDGVSGAVLFQHSVDDNVVSIEYSRNLMKILDKTNVIHSLDEYQSGGHNISGSNFTNAMTKTVEFFKTQFDVVR